MFHKNKTTKLAFLMLSLIVILSVAFISCDNNDSSKPKTPDPNDFRFDMNDDGTIEITDYLGKHREIIIPDIVNDFTVTSIGPMAFNNKKLKYVTIPNTVKFIRGVEVNNTSINDRSGAFAFNNLTSITIPNSVEFIGAGAFRYNEIKSIVIPNLITSIEAFAFANNLIESIDIPSNISSIDHTAFRGNRLHTITIGSNVEVHPTAFNTDWSLLHPDADTNFTEVYNNIGGVFKRPTYTMNIWTRMY